MQTASRLGGNIMSGNSSRIILAILITASASTLAAAQTAPANPQIDYQGFATLTNEVADYRVQRLVSMDQFMKLSEQQNAIILDTRSVAAFASGHIAGAINLPFSDFTEAKLAKVIGPSDRPILIYCNNNFNDNRYPITTKAVTLALNIPTFINLYGYGYKNIFELNDVVATRDLGDTWIRSDG